MALKIHSGELKRKVMLMAPSSSRNNQGGKEKSFVMLEDGVRARIKKRQVRTGGEIAPALLHNDEIVFRYNNTRAGITKDHRVNYNGMDHTINEIEFHGVEENEWILLVVKKLE